jgi:hypothetical protein
MSLHERRLQIRYETPVDASIVGCNGRDDEQSCVVLDHSEGGARLHLEDSFTPPDLFLLRAPFSRNVRLAQVRWRRADQIGVEFVEPEALSARLEFLHAQIETLQLRMNNLRSFVERELAGAPGADAKSA